MATEITVGTTVHAPVEKVWEYFTKPEHIVKWNHASDDWHSPHAENDLRVGGKFKYAMAAKDGSYAFDFEGDYSAVEDHKLVEYGLADGRTVRIIFTSEGDSTHVTETFGAEDANPVEIQKAGWQAILENFKKYTEGN